MILSWSVLISSNYKVLIGYWPANQHSHDLQLPGFCRKDEAKTKNMKHCACYTFTSPGVYTKCKDDD